MVRNELRNRDRWRSDTGLFRGLLCFDSDNEEGSDSSKRLEWNGNGGGQS